MHTFFNDPERQVAGLDSLLPKELSRYVWCIFGDHLQGDCPALLLGSQEGQTFQKNIVPSAAALDMASTITNQGHGGILTRLSLQSPEFSFFDATVQQLLLVPVGVSHVPNAILLVPADRAIDKLLGEGLFNDFVHDAGMQLLSRWNEHRNQLFTVDVFRSVPTLTDFTKKYLDFIAYWIRPQSIDVFREGELLFQTNYQLPYGVQATTNWNVEITLQQISYTFCIKLPDLANDAKIDSPRRKPRQAILKHKIAGEFQLLAGLYTQFRQAFNSNIDLLKQELENLRLSTATDFLVPQPQARSTTPASPAPSPVEQPKVKIPVRNPNLNHFYWNKEAAHWEIVFKGHRIQLLNKQGKAIQSPGLINIWSLIRSKAENSLEVSNLRVHHLLRFEERFGSTSGNRKTQGHDSKMRFMQMSDTQHMERNKNSKQVIVEVRASWESYLAEFNKLFKRPANKTDATKIMNGLETQSIILKKMNYSTKLQNGIQQKWKEILPIFEGLYGKYNSISTKLQLDYDTWYYIERSKREENTKKNIANAINGIEKLHLTYPGAKNLADFLKETIIYKVRGNEFMPFQFLPERATNPADHNLNWKLDE